MVNLVKLSHAKNAAKCIAAAAACAAILIIATAHTINKQDNLVRIRLKLPNHLVKFERTIGYGGLIHNFKNTLLRPDEPAYARLAQSDAVRALELLGDIETLTRAAEINVTFDRQRNVISKYRDAISTVQRMHEAGSSVRDIDAEVRIYDDDALEELVVLSNEVMSVIAAEVRQTERIMFASQGLFVGLGLGVALLGFLIIKGRHNAVVDAIAGRNAEVERFAQIAAHDLTAPLRHIELSAGFAITDLNDPDQDVRGEVMDHLSVIRTSAERARKMVAAVFSYVDAGQSSECGTKIDMNILIENASSLMLPKHVALRLLTPVPVIVGNAVEVETVLRNLLSNAVKHHPKNSPKIDIHFEQIQEGWVMSVIDDGPGVPDEYKQRIFDMFWSSQRAAGDSVNGVGLGVVARIVQGWGGSIDVTDAIPHGSIFAVTLPAQASLSGLAVAS